MAAFISCSDDDTTVNNSEPKLIVKLITDATLDRLGNDGSPVNLPETNAGQNPVFNGISAHYLELAPTAWTQIGEGAILYHAPETTAGGANAIDFSKSNVVTTDDTFLEIPLSDLQPGSYEWVRLSLSYQNFDVDFYYDDIKFTGTLASFVGFNTYIDEYFVKNRKVAVNGNKLQGYWGFEALDEVQTGQTPEGGTTVPNPLFDSSPIPAGSCVVTGNFEELLTITGEETEDVVLYMRLSTNKSFEWVDTNGNGKWDVDSGTESVVDMGVRGLFPDWKK